MEVVEYRMFWPTALSTSLLYLGGCPPLLQQCFSVYKISGFGMECPQSMDASLWIAACMRVLFDSLWRNLLLFVLYFESVSFVALRQLFRGDCFMWTVRKFSMFGGPFGGPFESSSSVRTVRCFDSGFRLRFYLYRSVFGFSRFCSDWVWIPISCSVLVSVWICSACH